RRRRRRCRQRGRKRGRGRARRGEGASWLLLEFGLGTGQGAAYAAPLPRISDYLTTKLTSLPGTTTVFTTSRPSRCLATAARAALSWASRSASTATLAF